MVKDLLVKLSRRQKIALSVGAVVLLLASLFYTHSGQSLIIGTVNRIVTGLNVNLVEGRLLSGGTLDIQYRSEQLTLNINNLQINLSLFDCATACFTITGDSLQLNLLESSTEPETSEPREGPIKAPLYIAIRQLEFAQIQITGAGQSIDIDQLLLRGAWQGEQLNVAALLVNSIKITQDAATPDSASKKAPLTQLAAIAEPVIAIPLTIKLKTAQIKQFQFRQGEQLQQVDNIGISAAISPAQISWQNLHLNYQQVSVGSQGKLSKNSHWQLSSNTSIELPKIQLTIQTAGNLSAMNLTVNSKGQVQSDVKATVNFSQTNWPFSFEALVRPMALDPWLEAPLNELFLQQLAIKANGNANDYQLTVNAGLDDPQLGKIAANVKANGSLNHATIDLAELTIDKAKAAFSGKLDWLDQLQASANGKLQQLPLNLLIPGEKSQLSGQFRLTAAMQTDTVDGTAKTHWQLNVPELILNGQLQGKPLALNGQFRLNEQLFGQIEKFELGYGNSRVTLAGTLSEQLNLAGQLKIDHQKDSLLPLDLAMQGKLALTGLRDKPTVKMNANIEQLTHAQAILGKGTIDAHIDGSANWLSDITLHVDSITVAEQQLSNVSFKFNGDLSQHRLTASSTGSLALDLAAEGSWQDAQWQGWLQQLSLNYQMAGATHPQALPVKLLEPINLTLSAEQMMVPQHCWQVINSEICLQAQQDSDNKRTLGEGVLTIKNLHLADADRWIGEGLTITGSAAGQFMFNWQDGRLSKVDGDLNGQAIELHTDNTQYQPNLPIEKLALTLTSDATLAQVHWQLDSSLIGSLLGDFNLPLSTEKNLGPSGSVEIAKMNLNPLAMILNKVLKQPLTLAGEVSGKVTLTNLLQVPKLDGQIAISDFALASSGFPVALNQSSITLDLQGTGGKLTSKLHGQQGGDLALIGAIDWQNELSGELTLQGRDFLVVPEPDIKLSLTPDLSFSYHNQKAIVGGSLTVPYGRIEIKSLEKGLIQPSDDQIIIDDDSGPRASRSPVDYSVDLDVIIKDDFRVIAMGLDSYIVGQIDISKQPTNPLLATGELRLREGSYKALGQDLQIKTGQIGFNGPLDKPFVNIRAIRNPEVTADDVIAGVEITGSISNPKINIYSEPAMDQARALAYLLYGEPLGFGNGEGDSSSSAILAQLLLSQSIGRSKGLVSKVGGKLGFEDVSLRAKGSGDNTKVEVSGYLTPSTQVSYRVGVFDSLSEIAIRYRIFSKLYIEATSGLYDSIDLLYKFDWDN